MPCNQYIYIYTYIDIYIFQFECSDDNLVGTYCYISSWAGIGRFYRRTRSRIQFHFPWTYIMILFTCSRNVSQFATQTLVLKWGGQATIILRYDYFSRIEEEDHIFGCVLSVSVSVNIRIQIIGCQQFQLNSKSGMQAAVCRSLHSSAYAQVLACRSMKIQMFINNF